jgi:hypothetical protein
MSEKSNPVLITVLLWLLLAGALVLNALKTGGIDLSTDDAMRLAEVRDLLAGQSWFDTAQWRMNTPYGLPMHWSRLIDAGIGGLILLFRLAASPKTAETLALYVWPLLWLLPSLLAIARMGTRLAGRVGGLFALLLGASCSAAVEPFRPGSIDHDNVQLALELWMMASLTEFDRARWAPIAAALLACLSLAVGMQTLPYVVVALLTVALWWIADGEAIAPRIRVLGMTFAVASVALLGGATASAYRFAATCDTFSGFYAALGLAGGIGLVAISSTPSLTNTKLRRTIAFVVLGCALVGLAAIVGPQCLKGPYAAVDPRLGPIWFSRISEVQSPFALAPQEPGNFLAGYCYAVLAALGTIASIFLVEKSDRRAAMVIAAIAVAALIATSVEIRALAYAQMYALPALATFVVIGVSRFRFSKALGAVTTVVALFAASDASFALAGHSIQTSLPKNKQFDALQESWTNACLAQANFKTLASLPKGRVLGLVDQGPYILTYTHHSAVSGPYHRDAFGIIDTYDAFTGTPVQSAAIMARRGIDYVAICKPAPDYAFYRAHDGGKGILSLLAKGQRIAWLEPIKSTAPGKVELYRVR